MGFRAHKIEKDLDSQHHGSLWSLFSTFDFSFSVPSLASQTPYHLTSSTITMAASFISLSLTPKAKPVSVMEPNILSQPTDEQQHPATSQRDTSSHPDHQGETEQQERRSFTPRSRPKGFPSMPLHPCSSPPSSRCPTHQQPCCQGPQAKSNFEPKGNSLAICSVFEKSEPYLNIYLNALAR